MNKKQGFTLIDVLISTVIFSLFATGIVILFFTNAFGTETQEEYQEGEELVSEGVSAIAAIRNENFSSLKNGTYGLNVQNGKYVLGTTTEVIDNYYTRTVTIEGVLRDSFGNINSFGFIDPYTKKVTVTVSFSRGSTAPRVLSETHYVTAWPGNEQMDTLYDELIQGNTSGSTSVVYTDPPPPDDGGVQLAPSLYFNPFYQKFNLGVHGNDVYAKDGQYIFVTVDQAACGYRVIDFTNPDLDFSAPQNASKTKTCTDATNPLPPLAQKGNKIAMSANGKFLFVTVESKSKGFAVLDISNSLLPVKTAEVDLGNTEGRGAEVIGNTVYVGTADKKLVKIDVNPTTGTATILSTINICQGSPTCTDIGVANDITISGNYAYLAVSNSTKGLVTVDISGATPVIKNTLNVNENANGIALRNSYLYIATKSEPRGATIVSLAQPGTPTCVSINPAPCGGIDFNGLSANDLFVSAQLLIVGLEAINPMIRVYNISSNPIQPMFVEKYGECTGSPSLCDKTSGVFEFTHPVTQKNYIAATVYTGNTGLIIFGSPKEGFSPQGGYVSRIFDTGTSSPVYRYIAWDTLLSGSSTINFQMRFGSTTADLQNSSWTGLNGSSSAYYTVSPSPITVPVSVTNPRYYQYNAFFYAGSSTSPVLESVTVNYSP